MHAENKEEKNTPAISTGDGYSPLLRISRKANPSLLRAIERMILLIAAALVVSCVVLFVIMPTPASVGMPVLIDFICIVCLVPLIIWMKKTKYGKGTVISNDTLQRGFVSGTVSTSVCRVIICAWAVLIYTIGATVFEWVNSWISNVWFLLLIVAVTDFASLFFSVVPGAFFSQCSAKKRM